MKRIGRSSGSDAVSGSRSPHRPPAAVPDDVRHAAASLVSTSTGGQRTGYPKVLTHLFDEGIVYPLSQGKVPVTHRDGQPQAQINQRNPFHRFLQVDLKLEETFLDLPKVIVKFSITKAIIENQSPQRMYQFLAWCFGTFSQDEYTAICMTQMALLYENKDTIIRELQHPNASARIDNITLFIAKETGLLINVDPDPMKTIQLIENALRVGQKILDEVPKNDNPDIEKANIKTKFENSGIFKLGDIIFSDHFHKMQTVVFNGYAQNHPVVNENRDGEIRTIQVSQPRIRNGLTHADSSVRKEFLAQELVAYKSSMPANAPDDYMSASAFAKYILNKHDDIIMGDEGIRNEVFMFIQEAIDGCLLGLFISDCDDTKDSDEKIIEAEFEAYKFNVYRNDKEATKTTKAFRDNLLKKHTNLQTYKVDRWIQQAIKYGRLPRYEPKYEANETSNRILNEEVMAYKLNHSTNPVLIPDEINAVKKSLKDKIQPPNGQPGALGPVTEQAIDDFLQDYEISQAEPYFPNHNKRTAMQKILDEEYDAYILNKPTVNAPQNYNTKSAFQEYLLEERDIFKIKGMRTGASYPENITQQDLDGFTYKPSYSVMTPVQDIIEKEFDAYLFNKPANAPANYVEGFKNDFLAKINATPIQGMRAGGNHPENITEQDIDDFLTNHFTIL